MVSRPGRIASTNGSGLRACARPSAVASKVCTPIPQRDRGRCCLHAAPASTATSATATAALGDRRIQSCITRAYSTPKPAVPRARACAPVAPRAVAAIRRLGAIGPRHAALTGITSRSLIMKSIALLTVLAAAVPVAAFADPVQTYQRDRDAQQYDRDRDRDRDRDQDRADWFR